jgi:hypothetical protein
MSKIFSIIEDLQICYQANAPSAGDYDKLSSSEKYEMCREPKKALIKYVNSKEFNFKDIALNLQHNISSKINCLI